jgi:hypothetical protein
VGTGGPVFALDMQAKRRGRALCERVKDLIPRQLSAVATQAPIGGRIMARETVKASRKDVLAKCYGGDVTKKRMHPAVLQGRLWVNDGPILSQARSRSKGPLSDQVADATRPRGAHQAIRHPPAGRQRVRPAQLTLSDPLHGEQPTADRAVSAE